MARILVVDDQKISRLTLAGILGDADHIVRGEASGPDGIAAAQEWLPDVIILDVHMPGMDGFEVVARLKEDRRTESIPVVFLTGEPPTDDLIVRGLDLGAYDFLSKGCSKAELLARVSVMERIKRNHDELAAIARISDALLRSVEPEALGRQFAHEAAQVFRADAVILHVERDGQPGFRIVRGLDDADDVTVDALLDAAGDVLDCHDTTDARILNHDQVRALLADAALRAFGSAALASVRRGPTSALVLIMAADPGLYRDDIDGPLIRNLGSQAAMAIDHALLNQRARAQARDLARAMSERSRFFASLSHELRTPINAVIGYNHLLREQIFGTLNERQAGALEKADRSAQHLLELVDDILDISKIEAGKLEIFPEDVDLPALLRDTATSIQIQAQEKGLDLHIETPESAAVRTDPARVRQIVLNLLSNAVKFTEQGRVGLRLATGTDGRVTIYVSDTGRGIPPEDRERIFDEFEQGSSGGSGTGTGLGLAISRRLADLLGGDLRVESDVGVGSTFVLTLPRESPPAPAAAEPTPL
jgi:signal transduction histidine kinase